MKKYKFSTKEFENYKYRVKFVAENLEGEQEINTDVYTDCEDKGFIIGKLTNLATKKGWVTYRPLTGVLNFSTKEQDEHDAEFIDEFLGDF